MPNIIFKEMKIEALKKQISLFESLIHSKHFLESQTGINIAASFESILTEGKIEIEKNPIILCNAAFSALYKLPELC